MRMGQGDCTVIKTPSGKVYMIDLGTSEGEPYPGDLDSIYSPRTFFGDTKLFGTYKTLNGLILTHADKDHYNGVGFLHLLGIKIEKVYHSDFFTSYDTGSSFDGSSVGKSYLYIELMCTHKTGAKKGEPDYPNIRGVTYTGDDKVFTNAVARAAATRDAAMETEFGATDDIPYLEEMVARGDRFMVPWLEWAYCGCQDPTTSGPGNKQAIVIDPAKTPTGTNLESATLRALVEPYPQVVAGTPEAWGFTRSTRTFTLDYSTTRASGSHRFKAGSLTEITAPALVYRGRRRRVSERVRRPEADPQQRPTAGGVARLHKAAVGLRGLAHDGQPEPRARL